MHAKAHESIRAATVMERFREQHGNRVTPLYIKVHATDNVAIVVNPEGLPAGTAFPDGPTLRERIPQSHKVALRDFEPGAPVIRYGQVIGTAAIPIAAGAWVREDMVNLPTAPPLDQLPLATAVPTPLP